MWAFRDRDNLHRGFMDFEKEIIKQRIKEKQAIVAYSISYGGGTLYEHAECFEFQNKNNPNNLTPSELEQAKSVYKPLTVGQIPEGATCRDCHKPIQKELYG